MEPLSNDIDYRDALFVISQYRGACPAFELRYHFAPEKEPRARWVTVERPGVRRKP